MSLFLLSSSTLCLPMPSPGVGLLQVFSIMKNIVSLSLLFITLMVLSSLHTQLVELSSQLKSIKNRN